MNSRTQIGASMRVVLWLYALGVLLGVNLGRCEAVEWVTLPNDNVKYFRLKNPKSLPKPVREIKQLIGGRSVALLVAVSDYARIDPDLPCAVSDANRLADALVNGQGFDEVYLMENSVGTPDLVKKYVLNKFRKELGGKDRLLFYFNGHGVDYHGATGYLQFADAGNDDWVTGALRIDECREWCRQLDVGHALFIFDTCVSGLMLDQGVFQVPEERSIIGTLRGNGSRRLITAGTGNESTYCVPFPDKYGSILTRSLIETLGENRSGYSVLTIDELFEEMKRLHATYQRKYHVSVTPRKEVYLGDANRGSFLFLNDALVSKGAPIQIPQVPAQRYLAGLPRVIVLRIHDVNVNDQDGGNLVGVFEMSATARVFNDAGDSLQTELRRLKLVEAPGGNQQMGSLDKSNSEYWVDLRDPDIVRLNPSRVVVSLIVSSSQYGKTEDQITVGVENEWVPPGSWSSDVGHPVERFGATHVVPTLYGYLSVRY